MKIISSPVTPIPDKNVSQELKTLILWLLEKDPKNRPTIKELLCESFIRSKMAELPYIDVPNELQNEFIVETHKISQPKKTLQRSTGDRTNNVNNMRAAAVSGSD